MRRTLGYAAIGFGLAVALACGLSGDIEPEETRSITIRAAHYGTALDSRYGIAHPVEAFQPTDPVCISLELAGRPRSGIVTIRWQVGTQVVNANVDLATVNREAVLALGRTQIGGTLTHAAPLPPGNYETIVLFNGTEVGRYPFRVAGEPPVAAILGPFTSVPPENAPTPPGINPFPSTSQVIHAVWRHPNVPLNEQVTFTLIAVDVGRASPPNTTVGTAQINAPQGGPYHGPVQFSLPRPWPPGSYRLTGAGSTLGPFASLDFRVQ